MDADKYVLVKCVLTETTVEFGPAPQSVPWTGYRGGRKVRAVQRCNNDGFYVY